MVRGREREKERKEPSRWEMRKREKERERKKRIQGGERKRERVGASKVERIKEEE